MLTCICATCSPSQGTGTRRACDRQAHSIGVAFVEAEAGGLHRAAEHVECEHRAGQQQAHAVHALEFSGRDALAAGDSHEVGEQQIDVAHLRMTLEPGGGRAEFRKLRHVTPVV